MGSGFQALGLLVVRVLRCLRLGQVGLERGGSVRPFHGFSCCILDAAGLCLLGGGPGSKPNHVFELCCGELVDMCSGCACHSAHEPENGVLSFCLRPLLAPCLHKPAWINVNDFLTLLVLDTMGVSSRRGHLLALLSVSSLRGRYVHRTHAWSLRIVCVQMRHRKGSRTLDAHDSDNKYLSKSTCYMLVYGICVYCQ